MRKRVSSDLVYSRLAAYGANRSNEKVIFWPKAYKMIEELENSKHSSPGELVQAIADALVKAEVSPHRWNDYAGFAFFYFDRPDLFAEHQAEFPRVPAGATAVPPSEFALPDEAPEIRPDEFYLNPETVARDRLTMDLETGDLFRPKEE
jgi:hypothetical protein